MLKVAINGFGRIGRNVLRALYESGKSQQIKVVAVNELAQPDAMAHLLQYDTSHGRFGKKISNDQEHIYIHHESGEFDTVRILHLAEIDLLPWRDLEVDIVLDCTGVYGCRADGLAHIELALKRCCSHTQVRTISTTPLFMVLITIPFKPAIALFPMVHVPPTVSYLSSRFLMRPLVSILAQSPRFTRR